MSYVESEQVTVGVVCRKQGPGAAAGHHGQECHNTQPSLALVQNSGVLGEQDSGGWGWPVYSVQQQLIVINSTDPPPARS